MFASAGQSTRTPTPVELTCGDPAAPCRLPNAFVSDPPLAQVIARNIEIGARGRLGSAHWSVAAYRTDNDRDLIFISSGAQRGTGYFANIGRTQRAGIETAADGSISDRFQWRAAWAFLDATFRDGFLAASPHNPFAIDGEIHVMPGDRLPLTPAHTATLAGSLRLSSSARLEATARYVSGSFFRGDEANVAAPLPGYVTSDASIRFALTPRLALELSGTNVTNERYATFGTFGDAAGVLGQAYDDPRFVSPAQPRAFHVALRYSGSR
jgi:iron complex outermembrane receptor protein